MSDSYLVDNHYLLALGGLGLGSAIDEDECHYRRGAISMWVCE